jgi:CheY-like chemotaxis protein
VVAVIDDTEAHRRLARLLLEEAYEVHTYADGAGALRAFAAGAVPDLVLLDVYMPGLGGRDVLACIRDRAPLGARFARVPVIAFSARARPADLTAYRTAGFDGWIGKPLDEADEFRARVAEYLARARPPALAAAPAGGERRPAGRDRDDAERARLAHDLRSPLSAVVASLRLLRHRLGPLGAGERELLDMADRGAARVLEVIGERLDADAASGR